MYILSKKMIIIIEKNKSIKKTNIVYSHLVSSLSNLQIESSIYKFFAEEI